MTHLHVNLYMLMFAGFCFTVTIGVRFSFKSRLKDGRDLKMMVSKLNQV